MLGYGMPVPRKAARPASDCCERSKNWGPALTGALLGRDQRRDRREQGHSAKRSCGLAKNSVTEDFGLQ